jgi:hypothetical protein
MSCAAVQLVAVGGNVVVVVLSPPSGAIVVIIEDVGLGLVVWAPVVHPATIIVMATAATMANLRTLGIMAPPVSSAVSRTTPGRDDNGYGPRLAEVGMRTLADGGVD